MSTNPIVGYRLSILDNDRYMLRDEKNDYDEKDYPRCSQCGMKTDPIWIDSGFRLGRRKLDCSATYDGYVIVSHALKEILAGSKAEFVSLAREPGYYVLNATETFPFDPSAANTMFEEWCHECDRFVSIARAEVFPRANLPERLIRSDQVFGWKNEQHPIHLVGRQLGQRILAQEFSGVDLVALYAG